MKSISTKFIALILAGIVISSSLIGIIAVIRVDKNTNNSTTAMLNTLANWHASEINGLMGRIEKSVEVIAGCAEKYVQSADQLYDEDFCDEYMEYIDSILLNAANATDGSVSVYIRLNPEITTPSKGLFYIKTGHDAQFHIEPNTDLSLYEPTDIEHVGWYFVPVANGKPTWMEPYQNKNIGVYMISYIIPIYCRNDLLGVVGMDIDFNLIQSKVDSIQIYDTGYAYLADDNFDIVYHRNLPKGTSATDAGIVFKSKYEQLSTDYRSGVLYEYEHNGIKRRMSFRKLNNGVNLYITAPLSEIDKAKNEVVLQIMIATVVAALLFVIVTIVICRTLIRPLKRLTAIAEEIASGDLSVKIDINTKDEIGTLARAFRHTVKKLRIYIDKMSRLAYLDTLTGVQNKTAYADVTAELEQKIADNKARFALVVLDINGLKNINDTKGHYYGDLLISSAAKLITGIFIDCPTYRIGGDEFVVLLNGIAYDERRALYGAFRTAMQVELEKDPDDAIIIASGLSEFIQGSDKSYDDVFKRADSAMYNNKKEIKKEVDIPELNGNL